MGMGPPEALTSVCGDAKPPRVYSLLYVSAFPTNIVSMRVCDYYTRNRTKWMRITRGTSVEAPQPLVALLNDYLRAARFPKRDDTPLFRADGSYPMTPSDIRSMLLRRRRHAGASRL